MRRSDPDWGISVSTTGEFQRASSRENMSSERTASVNALTALLRTADLGLDARKPLTNGQITEVASWRTRVEDLELAAARAEAYRLAKRVRALDIELADNRSQLEELLRQSKAAPLLDVIGVGPVTAAVAYSAWSHRGGTDARVGVT